MLKRLCTLGTLGLALTAMLLQAQDLFVLPGAGAGNGEVEAFATNPLTVNRSFQAGSGSFSALSAMDGTEIYVIAASTAGTVTSIDTTFLNPQIVANLPQPATGAVLTPDGKLLAVVAGPLYIFNTATNTNLTPNGISQGTGINSFAVASSLDATTLYVLGNSSAGTSQLTAINTTTFAAAATLPLTQSASALAVGPNGLVYVGLTNQLLELDPRTLQSTLGGIMTVAGPPGSFVFTPDGQYLVAANQSSSGGPLFIVSLNAHTVSTPNLGLPRLSGLQVIGLDTVLAASTQGAYDITIAATPTVTAVETAGTVINNVAAISVSNDVPAGTHAFVQAAYLISGANLYQFNPATPAVVDQTTVASNITAGALSFAAPALPVSQTTPVAFLSYGTNQTILPNATSEPLVVQVLDPNSHPISGVTVQFQNGSGTVGLASATAVTGANGYALTYFTAPATTGSFTITATTGSLKASFQIQVSSSVGVSTVNLSIVAGQGQIMVANSSTTEGTGFGSPLQVMATDSGGNALANVPITFSVPSNEGTLQVNDVGAASQIVNTSSTGLASVDFLTTTVPSDNTQGFLQTPVTITAPNALPVTIYITTVQNSPLLYVLAPAPGSTLHGQAGGILPAAVKVQVLSPVGVAIPNVAITVNDGGVNPEYSPSVACNVPGGLVLTNAFGLASCDLIFGPRLGTGSFITTIGFTHSGTPIAFTVAAGSPAVATILGGNNQSGTPGEKLPVPLLIHLTDAAGNLITGSAVNWQVVTPGTVTLSNVIATTDSNGNSSAIATLGSVAGVAQVTATAGAASATFNLTVVIPTAGIQKVSGDQQTALINTAFALPLTVKVVDSNGNGLAGAPVNFQVTSGTATLGASSATTDSTGQASTTVTAGATAGAITVTATSGTFSAIFSLTALPPGPTNITILNGASFDPNSGISPGAIATISGTGILPGVKGLVSAVGAGGQLPTTFSGVTITFNGTAAPIYWVQDTNGADQVTVQVPFEVQPGPSVSLTVKVATTGSTTVMVPVQPLSPAFFTAVYAGKNYAQAVRPDGSPVSPTNPAQRGENIQLYVTGLAQATPAIATGAAGVANQTIDSSVIVGLNNGGIPLVSAVYGPGLIGVYVATIQIPQDVQTGSYQPLGMIAFDSKGNPYFAQTAFIPVQ